MAKRKPAKKKRPPARKSKSKKRQPKKKAAPAPGLLKPAEASEWIAAAGDGLDPALILAMILEDIGAGAPTEGGLIDPVVYTAWLIQRGADAT